MGRRLERLAAYNVTNQVVNFATVPANTRWNVITMLLTNRSGSNDAVIELTISGVGVLFKPFAPPGETRVYNDLTIIAYPGEQWQAHVTTGESGLIVLWLFGTVLTPYP